MGVWITALVKKTEKLETPQLTKSYYVLKNYRYVVTAGMDGEGGGSSGNIKVNVGQKNKHIPDANNYNQYVANGKNPSILKGNPQQLLDDFVGTGKNPKYK